MTLNSCKRILAVALLFGLSANTTLAEDNERRELDNFHAITVSGGIDLELHQGEHYSVIVHASSGDADEVETEVDHETLVISRTSSFFSVFRWFGLFHLFEHYSVEVTLPRLEKVYAGGGSNVEFDHDFSGDQLELRASGGTNLRFRGKLNSLDITSSGGSDTFLEGSTHLLKVRASGGSDLHALKFEVGEAEVSASGGSDIAINVQDKMTVRASGGSDVHYAGHPKQTDIKSSGGSDVRAH